MTDDADIDATYESIQKDYEAALVLALKDWPNACRGCGGTGFTGGDVDRHTGISDGGPCSCVEAGICPRCASKDTVTAEQTVAGIPGDYLVCRTCHFDEATCSGPVLPTPPFG